MTDHMRVKAYLQSIGKTSELRAILESYILSDEDRLIMEMLYIERKPMDYVADVLGFSVSCVKKRHHRILSRMSNYLDECKK